MAEIRDDLILEIDQALRSVDQLGQAIDSALGAARDIQVDDSSFRTIDQRLASIEASVADTVDEIATLETSARASEASFAGLARELGVSEREAEALTGNILEASRAGGRLDAEARQLAQSLGLSDAAADDLARGLARSTREIDQTNSRAATLRSTFFSLRTAIVGAVAAFGVRGLLSQADSAIDSFNALNESVNAVNVTFGDGAAQIFEFGETAARSAGLARSAFQQSVVPIGALLQNFGFDARQSATAAIELTQRAADLASVFNVEVSEALDAVGSALRGETEPIRRFGVDASVAAVSAAALASGLVSSADELEGATLATARLNEILRQTDRVAGDFANTITDPANAARVLASEFEDARVTLGAALIPAFQELLAIAPDVVEDIKALAPAIEGAANAAVQAAPGVVSFIGKVAEALDEVTFGLQLADVRTELVDTFGAAERGIGDILRAIFLTDIDEQFNALFVSSAEVEAAVSRTVEAFNELDDALEGGGDPIDVLAQALGRVGRETELTGAAIAVFAQRAGIADLELRDFLLRFRDSSQAIGLTDREIRTLNLTLLELDALLGAGEGFLAEDIFPNVRRQRQQIEDTIVTLAELRAAADEAGVSIGEAFGSDLFEGQTFDSLARLEVELAGFRDRINEIGAGINPLEGAAERVDVSVDEFIDNITAQFEQQVEFEAALERLGQRGFDSLEAVIRELGPGALSLVEGFLEDAAAAQVAEDIFDPVANDYANAFESALRGEFTAVGFDGLARDVSNELAAAFINQNFERLSEDQVKNIAAGVESPASISFVGQAGTALGEQLTNGIVDFINDNADAVGEDSVRNLAAGLTSTAALEQAILAGRTVADVFNQALAENIRFDFGVPEITRAPTFGGPQPSGTNVGPNVGLPVQIEQTINTTPEREQTDVARATQLAGATARNIQGLS